MALAKIALRVNSVHFRFQATELLEQPALKELTRRLAALTVSCASQVWIVPQIAQQEQPRALLASFQPTTNLEELKNALFVQQTTSVRSVKLLYAARSTSTRRLAMARANLAQTVLTVRTFRYRMRPQLLVTQAITLIL